MNVLEMPSIAAGVDWKAMLAHGVDRHRTRKRRPRDVNGLHPRVDEVETSGGRGVPTETVMVTNLFVDPLPPRAWGAVNIACGMV